MALDLDAITNALEKFLDYVGEWNKFLLSSTEQSGAKQSYFLDTKEDIVKIKTRVKGIIDSNPPQSVLETCTKLDKLIEDTVMEFTQKTSVMNENITAEDTIPVITEETMNEALNSNKSTQRMVNNMNELEKQQQAAASTPFTHMLDIDDKTFFIAAKTKEELEKIVNEQVKTFKETPKKIELYELNPKKVQLTTKTIISLA